MNHRSSSRVARALLGAAMLLAALGSCTVLPPREDATRYFVLSTNAPAGSASSSGPETATSASKTALASDPSFVVSVGPVRLPDYLLRPEIVRRAGENQLDPSPIDRWAEPIDRATQRVLALDLAAAMPESTVIAFPSSPAQKIALEVAVEFARFEGSHAGAAYLDARWTLRDLRTGNQVLRASRLERASSSEETSAMVAAMSGLLGDLSREISREIGSLTR
jgi:uncharacterized protein